MTPRTQEARSEQVSEWLPTYRLDQRIAEARERMGEARWDELNAEWEQTT